jgi:hypothetical protein
VVTELEEAREVGFSVGAGGGQGEADRVEAELDGLGADRFALA